MANIAFPDILRKRVASIIATPEFPAQRNVSRWTGRSKMILLPGTERWTFRAAFRPLSTETEIRAARAWFFALKGQGNTTDLPVLQTQQFMTDSLGELPAAGAGAEFDVGSGKGLVAGCYVTITTEGDHKRLAVVESYSGGIITVSPPPDSAASGNLEAYNPVARVRLADPATPWPDTDGNVILDLAFEEAL